MLPSDVQGYVRATAGYPFIWGVSDCMMWSAGLVLEATGQDVAEDLREAYQTEEEAIDVVVREGGHMRLMTRRLAGVLRRDDGAQWGVGLARHDHFGRIACIIANGRTVLKTDGTALPADLPLVARWAL